MSKKIYDIVVKTGSYTKDGVEKGRYKNIGAVMQGDDGNPFAIMDRMFNPAGVPNPEGRDTFIASMFKVEEQGQQRQAPQRQAQQQKQSQAVNKDDHRFDGPDDMIPF